MQAWMSVIGGAAVGGVLASIAAGGWWIAVGVTGGAAVGLAIYVIWSVRGTPAV